MTESNNVLKVIDNLAEIISILLEYKKKGRFNEALKKVDETLLHYFKFDSNYILSISEDLFIDVLKDENGLNYDQLSSLAELLNEQGQILLEQNNLKSSKKTLQNALKIYYFLNDEQDFFSFKNMNKMLMINKKLAEIDLEIKS